MRFVALAVLALLAVPQDDAEAKKKKLGEILKEFAAVAKRADGDPKAREDAQLMEQLQKLSEDARKLIVELAGADREKQDALVEEVIKKHAPEAEVMWRARQRAANERNARATLKTIITAEADFRANDRDGNGANDFWVADVSGLYRIDVGGRIKLIEPSAAQADAKPCVPLDKEDEFKAGGVKLVALEKGKPKSGYHFAALETYEEDGKWLKHDDGKGRCASRFAFCTYPSQYGTTGKLTFIVNEENVIWHKDTHGEPPSGFPADPGKEGWAKRSD